MVGRVPRPLYTRSRPVDWIRPVGGDMGQDSSEGKTEWTHEAVVQRLAGEMYRSALWATLATVAVGVVLWTVLAGVPGLVAALIGGAVACVSSAGTLLLMHRTAAMP